MPQDNYNCSTKVEAESVINGTEIWVARDTP
jgi:hypothetical protein